MRWPAAVPPQNLLTADVGTVDAMVTKAIDKVRKSAVWMVGFISAAIAFATFFGVVQLRQYSASRRNAQIHISEFRGALWNLQAEIESANVGEVADVHRLEHELRHSFADLTTELGGDASKGLRLSFLKFIDLVHEKHELVQEENRVEARKLDEERLDPAFETLLVEFNEVNTNLADEAARANRNSYWILGFVLSAAAICTTLSVGKLQSRLLVSVAEQSQKEALAASERKLRMLIGNSADVITLIDKQGLVNYASGNSERVFGRLPAAIIGRPIQASCHPDDAARLCNMLAEVIEHERSAANTEVMLSLPDGSSRHAEVHAVNLLYDTAVNGVLVTFHDLTERKNFEEQLTHQAFHDKLTGLPNRALFMDRLTYRLATGERSGESVAIMFLDMDNFKVINDSLGHEAGDSLLVQFASHLRRTLRSSDTICRLGGDEFVIMLGGSPEVKQVLDLGRHIIQSLDVPFLVGERELYVSTSIGIASSTDSKGDADGLLRDADTAMYCAKANGKGNCVVFDRAMNAMALERLELEAELRSAIPNGELVLHFQPIVSIDTSELKEVEALVRWQHPTRGLIQPDKFIPIAEESGLILDIGEWVLHSACSQLKAWMDMFPGSMDLKMNVNVSGRQLSQPRFVEKVHRILKETHVEARMITLEVTETFMLKDLTWSAKVLQDLRDLGLSIAIDDFGTGYSSMAYLSRLPVDTLKIDRTFMDALSQEEGDGIVQAMITMAKTMGLNVVSEGVETPSQLHHLQELGCDLGQGFLFAKPLSAAGISRMLATSDKHAA